MQNGEFLSFERIDSKEVSVLQVLFDHYFDSKTEDEPNVEDAYKDFCHSLLDVDPFQIDEIMSTAAVLCMEHERSAFIAGIKTRVRLDQELSE